MSKLNPQNQVQYKADYIETIANRKTKTQNGALAEASTGSLLVDFFGTFGALRLAGHEEIVNTFMRLYNFYPEEAVKLLCYFRDCRGGQGERRIFHEVMRHLIGRDSNWLVLKMLPHIPELGYWDDINTIMIMAFEKNDKVVFEAAAKMYANQLRIDFATPTHMTLAAKWAFGQNWAKKSLQNKLIFACYLRAIESEWGVRSQRDYRRLISHMRQTLDVTEKKMSQQRWGDIIYPNVSSLSHKKHGGAFARHDYERYSLYLNRVETGKETINANVISPVELVSEYVNPQGKLTYKALNRTVEAQWKALPDYVTDDVLPVCDVSASMYRGKNVPAPVRISLSLSIYLAQRNKGSFKNEMITFDDNPTFMDISHTKSLKDAVEYAYQTKWGGSTDLIKTFDLILNTAIKNRATDADMPKYLLVISDMQFNRGTDGEKTPYEQIKRKFNAAGFKMPKIVWWNVDAKVEKTFASKDSDETLHISGFNPAILQYVLRLTSGTTEDVIQEILNSPRYAFVDSLFDE